MSADSTPRFGDANAAQQRSIWSGDWKFQILASPPMLTLDKIGMWTHLMGVIDGKARQAVQYLNGFPVSRDRLKFGPPFRIGSAELGNWNRRSDANPTPSLIRNLSGSLDEFEVFSRALSDAEARALYAKGKPNLEPWEWMPSAAGLLPLLR